MTTREKQLASVVAGLALLAAWYYLVFMPLQQARSQQQSGVAKLERQQQGLVTPTELAARKAALAAREAQFRSHYADSAPVVVQLLAGAESRSGVTVFDLVALPAGDASEPGKGATAPRNSGGRGQGAVDPGTTESTAAVVGTGFGAAGVEFIRMDIAVRGTLAQVLAFGQELEQIPVRVRLERWHIERPAGQGEGEHETLTGRYTVGVLRKSA